jgi:hypothetical protein
VKIEHGVNEKGEPVLRYSVEIPQSIDQKDYDAFAALVQQRMAAAINARLDSFWLQGPLS